MSNSKKHIWLDIVFILVGLITLLLLFMPEMYMEYRYVGYAGVGVFLVFLLIREYLRKKEKKSEEGGQQ